MSCLGKTMNDSGGRLWQHPPQEGWKHEKPGSQETGWEPLETVKRWLRGLAVWAGPREWLGAKAWGVGGGRTG